MSTAVWTTTQLARRLRLFYGHPDSERVNVPAAAAAMGVSPRTVQRWLHGSPRQHAQLPPRRIEQLLSLTAPSAQRLAQEQQQAAYAYRAVQQIRVPRQRGVLDSWRHQRWLEDHLVVVIAVPLGRRLTIRQLLIGRATGTKLDEFARRGRILDQATVPTRFDATLLGQRWLDQFARWRIQATPQMVPSSFTQVWTAEAPRTFLGRDAWQLQHDLAAFDPSVTDHPGSARS